jgi:Inovirus Coat protein B
MVLSKILRRIGVLAPVALAGQQAHAALPNGVSEAITSAGADMATAGGAVIVTMLAFWGLRKLGSKLGWW